MYICQYHIKNLYVIIQISSVNCKYKYLGLYKYAELNQTYHYLIMRDTNKFK